MGLKRGQAWFLWNFLAHATNSQISEMLVVAEVEECEKPLEGNDLAEAVAEVFHEEHKNGD